MAAMPTDGCKQQIECELQAGNASEHTRRPTLKTLIESLALAPEPTANIRHTCQILRLLLDNHSQPDAKH